MRFLKTGCTFAALLPALLLTGCSASFNPTQAPVGSSSFGTISGQVHGGRQGLVGAHLFVFAAGSGGDAGPGIAASSSNKSVSLISSAAAGAQYDSTIGAYYVLTGADGSFSITSDYSCTAGQQVYLYSVQGEPDGVTNNPNVGIMAVLGTCGSAFSGTTTVYMNEVSTIAAAYALAGFASDPWHVSSNGSALATTGIKNAFANAALLYNISALPLTARATTASNGTVPQKLINSLANSLAACVNSAGSGYSQCGTLFSDTRNYAGTEPTDTAAAAINIAHAPGANVSALFTLPGPIGYPFTPDLGTSTPNDFTIGITYTNSAIEGASGLAIDAAGDAWVAGDTSNEIVEFSPLGASLATYTTDIDLPVGVAIDSTGDVWIANISSVARITPGGSTANYPEANGPDYLAIDSANNVWITNFNDYSTTELDHNGNNVGSSPYFASKQTQPTDIAVSHAGNVWISETGSGDPFEITGGGTGANTVNVGSDAVYSVAIDSSDNAWYGGEGTGAGVIIKVSTSGIAASCNGGGSSYVVGLAVDGSGNLWGANSDNGGNHVAISECSSGATPISPTTGYLGGTVTFPENIAVDGSGDVWFTNFNSVAGGTNNDGETLVELIGAATPVTTPLSPNYPSKTTTGLGVRP